MIKIFLSSTQADLQEDCRPAVINAISLTEDVHLVKMETWAAPNKTAEELCAEKLTMHSTHYLGVFAYYRGSAPAGHSPSYTQLEYMVARKVIPDENRAIFVPNEEYALADELEKRALSKQQDEDHEKQKTFLQTVKTHGAIEMFSDVQNLSNRALRMAMLWYYGPIADQVNDEGAPPATGAGPTEADLERLGRRKQFREFEDVLELAVVPQRTCFLIQGAPGQGQKVFLDRLQKSLESMAYQGTLRQLTISCGALWRKNGLPGLLSVLSKELQTQNPLISVAEVATAIGEILGHTDVVMSVFDSQKYTGGPEAFRREFWDPLEGALPETATHRFAILAISENDSPIEPDASAKLFAPTQPALPPEAMILLSRLENLSLAEIQRFLSEWLDDPGDVATLGPLLHQQTKGHPERLFTALVEPSLWSME